MKKLLNRVLAVAIAAGLALMPVPAYGAFPDVPDSASYAYAVDALEETGIFSGDGNGNFTPDRTMTREEAATLMVRLFIEEEVSAPAKGSFSDVPTSQWSFGYIETAVKHGLISGYGNGKFGPSDTLTYNQMVTLLVIALGLGEMAQELGGWPDGYMMLGDELGITQNTVNLGSNPVPRSTVAVLVYNAWYEDDWHEDDDDEDYYWDDSWDADDWDDDRDEENHIAY